RGTTEGQAVEIEEGPAPLAPSAGARADPALPQLQAHEASPRHLPELRALQRQGSNQNRLASLSRVRETGPPSFPLPRAGEVALAPTAPGRVRVRTSLDASATGCGR